MNTKKRRLAGIILIVLLLACAIGACLVSVLKANLHTYALQGSGTETDPYVISSVDDLKAFRDDVNGGNAYAGKYVQLTCDLDLQCKMFESIGNTSAKPFKGIFNGGGHTVKNFYLKKGVSVVSAAGFFGYVTDAEVKNINFDNLYIYLYSNAGTAATSSKAAGTVPTIYGGGAVGYADNSQISGISIVGGLDIISGNGGNGYASTNTSYNKGGVGGTAYAGGVAGSLVNSSRISDCSFTGNVYVYGGVGGTGGGFSSGSYSGGAGGKGGDVYVGGVVGASFKNTEILRSCANAELLVRAGNGGNGGNGNGTTSTYKGGAEGAAGVVRGGGIVGATRGILIQDCFAIGNINMWNPVNGLPGSNYNYTAIITSSSTRNELAAGGIAGIINPETYTTTTTVVQNVYSQVNITEYYDNYHLTEINNRMCGIAGSIHCPNVKLKNAYTLAATYSGEGGTKNADGTTLKGTKGATMSPVATYGTMTTNVNGSNVTTTVAQVKSSIEALAEDIYYVEATRHNENTTSPKEKFNLVSAQVSEFGGTFNFDQEVWTGTSGLPVLKGVTLKDRPSFTFEINTAADLTAVAKKIDTGFVRFDTTININEDIDLGGSEWIGLGSEFGFCPFSLIVNGNGHKISNLYSTKTTDNKGFIGYARILHVKDLTIEDPVISGKGGNYAGALAGYVQYYGTFENCHVAQSAKMSAQNSIVRGKLYVGGLLGGNQSFAHRTSFLNCSSSVNVNVAATAAATYFSAGGLVGLSYGGAYKNCYVTGNVIADAYSGDTYYVGAFIGQVGRHSIIENCFATGNVQCGTEASFIGCISQISRGTIIKNCVYTGEVKYTYAVPSSVQSSFIVRYGGLVARCNAIEVRFINNVVLTPKVTFHANVGSTTNRRLGSILSSTAANKTLSNQSAKANAYPAVKNTAVYTNNFTLNQTNTFNIKHNGTETNNYFINDTKTNTRTLVDTTQIHTQDYWVNTIGFDFNDDWEWNENLEGGLPTLKDNKFNVAGMGGDAILISNKDELNTFRTLVNTGTSFEKKTVRMTADIDLGGTAWTPIGKDTATTFKGTFDGDGHTVYNLNVNKASAYKGFFVYLRDGAQVKNLTLVNPVIVSNAYADTGAVAGGMENASIINCHVKGGSITSTANNIGGIVGLIQGALPATVAKCSVTSLDSTKGYMTAISGKSNTGGIVGFANMTAALAATIEDCYCTRPVVALDNVYGIGGIAGGAYGTTVRRCYSSNTVAASRGSNVGGIVGIADKYKTEIYDCFSTGTVYSVGHYVTTADNVYSVAGGIIGRTNITDTKIERCYALGDILAAVQANPSSGVTNTSRATAGGILGYAYVNNIKVKMGANISLSPVLSAGVALNGNNQATSRLAITDVNATASITGTNTNYYLDGAYMSPTALRKSTNCVRWDSLASAKPAEDFREESLYTGIGWDMDEVWEMQDGVNGGLPYLKSLGAPVFETGSVYNPIQINDKEEFKAFANNVNSGINYDGQYVELNCNVDMTGITRIGYDYKHAFSGHFDGKGHKLTNVSINLSTDNVGVFGYVTQATIKNLTLDKPTVKQTGTAKGSTGGLIGYSLCNLTLENCAVTGGTVTSQGTSTGGLVGFANHGYNRITRCFSTAKVTGGARVGGLVGLYRNGAVERCYAVSDVTGNLTSNYASGGLLGKLDYGGSVQNCYAKGAINDSATASGAVAGGIVGEISIAYTTNINNCYFSGTLTARTTAAASGTRGAYVGGIVGLANVKITVTNCAVLATSMSATATQASNARTGYITNSTAANAPTMTNNLRLDTITVTTAKGSSFASQNTSTTTPKANFTSADLSVNKFSTTLAWDFDDIWTQVAGANDDLPMLTGLPTDVSDLETLLAAAKGYKEEDWNATTFAVLTEAIAEVEENITSINSDNKTYYLKLLSDAIEGLRPEKTSLQSLYDDVMLNKEPYKEWYTNFAAMDNALAQAKIILEEDSNKYKNRDVATALVNLIMANDNLQVDKTRLNEAIKKCSGVNESDYLPEEWTTLQAELKNAVKVFGNTEATAFEVKTATEALEAAIAGLKADKGNLEKKIAAAYSALGGEVSFEDGVMTIVKPMSLTAEKFVKFDTFEDALSLAEEIYAKSDALTSEVISSTYDLGVALNNLVLDRTDLRDEYNLASLKKQSQFTPESWAQFVTAFDNAGEVLQKPDAVPADFVQFSADIDDALEALKAAAAGLTVDKAQLEALIELAKQELDYGEIYEGDSLLYLQQALAEAEAVVANDEATALQISAAATKLNDAIHNLEINIDFLKKKLKEAETYLDEKDKEYYTSDSMSALEAAYDAAKVFVDGHGEGTLTAADLEAVKGATQNLTDALDGMQANVARLRELIERAENFDDERYDADSVAALKALAAVNEKMLDDGGYTNDQVIKGLKDLDHAFASLRADKSALIDLVEEVSSWVNFKYRQDEYGEWIVDENGNLKTFVVYSSDSWDDLQQVLTAAEAIVNKPDATVEEVEGAYENLLQAIDDLEIDLSEIKDRIKQANNILSGAAVYTDETTQALTDARDAAQLVVDTVATLKLEDVQAALDNLVAAIEGLEVDLEELTKLLDICEAQEERKECFTEATYSDMAAQAAFIKSILDKGDKITVQEFNDYINLLTRVLNQLEVDTSAMDEALEKADGLEPEFITAATYAAVQTAVANAEALLAAGGLTDADYEVKLAAVTDYVNYLKALTDALDGIAPDKVAFKAFIDEKDGLTSQAYSDETLDELKSAIANARTDLNSADVPLTYDALIADVEAIRAAILGLVPDTSKLAQKVEDIVGEMNTEHTAPIPDAETGEITTDPLYSGKDMFTYEYFTADSYAALCAVIDEVNDFLINPEGKTIADVQAMYDKLTAAYDALVLDKSALRELLDECNSLNGDYYSAASYAALQTAITNGESAYADEEITLTSYVAAYNALAEARDGLVYDTSSLDKLIAAAKAIIAGTQKEEGEEGKQYYTQDSIDSLKEVLEEAELFDPEATGDSDEASEALSNLADLCKKLSDAIENLVDLSGLRNKIAEAEAIDNDDGEYRASAFAALLTGIAEAKEVYANDEATAEEVAAEIEKIEKLIAALTAADFKFIIKEENTIYSLVDGKSVVLDQNDREYDEENPAYLVNVALNDSVADIISQFTNTDIRAFKADGTEITDFENTKIATGTILRLYSGEEIVDEITVVLKCDVNGDGKVNAVDKAQINGYFLGTKTLEGAYLLSCDINGDGKINAIDKAQINSYFLGNKNIYDGLSVKE